MILNSSPLQKFFMFSLATVIFLLTAEVFATSLVGKKAPDFTLNKLKGGKVTLAKLRQQGYVMLIFWAPECVYCFSHIKEFNQVQKKHKTKLILAAINFNGEHDSEVKEYIENYSPKYLFLLGRLKSIDVATSYKVMGSPTIVLISPKGKVLSYGHKIPKLSQWIK